MTQEILEQCNGSDLNGSELKRSELNGSDLNGSELNVGFLSTPSLYFSIPKAQRGVSKVFEFDRSFSTDPGFIFYDFNAPTEVPSELHHTFSMLVVDPPFVMEEVWAQYATTIKLLLRYVVVRCAVCGVRCAVCGVRCAVCGVRCAVCGVGD